MSRMFPSAASATPLLLVLGHITQDDFGTELRLGGGAAYAARAAAILGVETALVTVAQADLVLIDALRNLPRLSLKVAESDRTTTFGIRYSASQRVLTRPSVARDLETQDIPSVWRAAPAVYLGNVVGECGRELVEHFDRAHLTANLQGWLRRVDQHGQVHPALLSEAQSPPRTIDAAILSEADHPEAERVARTWAAAGVQLALTRGARGATIYSGSRQFDVPAAPATEVDPTGAGDVFGVVFGLALYAGFTPAQAAERAALAAARVVEGPEMGRLGEARIDLGRCQAP